MTDTLYELSDDELFLNAAQAIRRAAQGEADGGDDASYETALAFLAESDRRLTTTGHRERCRSGIYSQAYEVATALHAERQPQSVACNCAARRA